MTYHLREHQTERFCQVRGFQKQTFPFQMGTLSVDKKLSQSYAQVPCPGVRGVSDQRRVEGSNKLVRMNKRRRWE